LTGALHDLWLQLSPPLPSSLASKPANPGSPGKVVVKMERERESTKVVWNTYMENLEFSLENRPVEVKPEVVDSCRVYFTLFLYHM